MLKLDSIKNNERNFVVLDACRNNPLLSSTRDISGGLATVKEAHGTLIAYATSPGAVAEDGTQNSPYSTVLAELMTEPGQSVETLFRRVRTRVERITDNRQRPWTESGLSGDADYCFAGCDPRQAPASDEARADAARLRADASLACSSSDRNNANADLPVPNGPVIVQAPPRPAESSVRIASTARTAVGVTR